jgi:hypothetical protein
LLLLGIAPYQLAYSMKLPGPHLAYAAIMAVFGETSSGIRLGLLAILQEEIPRRERPTTLLTTVPAKQFRLRTKGRRAMPVPSKATIPPKLHIGQSQPYNDFTLCNRSGRKSVARCQKTQ